MVQGDKDTRGIQKGKDILEYFCFMIGNIAETWSCCGPRPDGDMLRMWFSFYFIFAE
jgi:hypothetical protein